MQLNLAMAVKAPSRSFAPRKFWWSELMPTAGLQTERLIREIETVRAVATAAGARVEAHEQVCAERMVRIDEKLDAVPKEHENIRLAIAGLSAEMKAVVADANKTAWGLNWKAWAIAFTLFASMLGTIGFLAAQVYGPQSHAEKVAPR